MGTLTKNDYRYERKFFISELTRHELESILSHHPALFSEIYYQRYVNNIYFDTANLINYFDNVDGSAQRVKVRIRWYGELFGVVEKPILELKIKNGLLGRKESFALKPFTIDNGFRHSDIVDVFNESDIPQELKLKLISLEPALLNRYSRKYFMSDDKDFRITIDSELTFYRINCHNHCFLHKSIDQNNLVLELKYTYDKEAYAERISNELPFIVTKSSKYVSGIERLHLF